jgi:Ca-activated chloride channel family protein
MLVIDRSSSMDGQEIRDAKAAAITFLHLMDLTQSQVGLVTFAKTAALDSPLTHDAATVEAALGTVKIESGSYIDRGINIAADELTSVKRNPLATPIMIILSDGRATDEAQTRIAAEQAKARGIRILTIGIGHHVNEVLLRYIASASEDFYASPSSTDLMGIYTQIAATIVTCQAPINNSSSSSLTPLEPSTPVPSPPIDATATVADP